MTADGTRILLAEDSPVIQRMLSVTLAKEGFKVETASNGREAATAVQFAEFDLILMDLRMPEMDGLEATKEIRQLSIRQPPIVALSGDDDASTIETCMQAGMNGHLTKPIVMKDMLEMITNLTAAE